MTVSDQVKACGKAWEACRTETVRKEASKPVLGDWGLGFPVVPMSQLRPSLLLLFTTFPASPPSTASRRWESDTSPGSVSRNLAPEHPSSHQATPTKHHQNRSWDSTLVTPRSEKGSRADFRTIFGASPDALRRQFLLGVGGSGRKPSRVENHGKLDFGSER